MQSGPLSLDALIGGNETYDFHLNTLEPIPCINCHQPFFFGQPLDQAKLYVQVIEYGDECETIDVAYPTFYPYNHGKDVCIISLDSQEDEEERDGSGTKEECGLGSTFGNHVSDVERIEIRFQNGSPQAIYLSVHSFGGYYAYNKTAHSFDFAFGETLLIQDGYDYGEGIRFYDETRVTYPPTVNIVEGNHPVVFSANGSHGSWASEGKHTYFNFFIHLDDYCERGEAWRTWENLAFVDRGVPDEEYYGTDNQWVNFKGRWGNTDGLGCALEPIIGICGLDSGVRGPSPPRAFGNDTMCGAFI
ncbi:hypothetical protein TCAL_03822 [Tigriopus californicus]|uniref:Uncharacterized protein n=2 Tax=Tigriopus californicus TaxID=6832 RepID=A0A553NS55_TIGCA|nr:hypothetical protein TCAL_03822 [Tigriopus californicus]